MIFIGLMAIILIGIWCVNNLMLEWFYINQKVDALQLGYTKMNELVMENGRLGGVLTTNLSQTATGKKYRRRLLSFCGIWETSTILLW